MDSDAVQAVAEPRDEELLDMELLNESAEVGGDDLRELIDMYLRQADQIMTELGEAVRDGKAMEVDHLAHKLAGSSAVCGASALMRSLRGVEQCGHDNKLVDAGARLVETAKLLERSRKLLNKYLSSI